jgi:hypothetical protein
MSSSRRTPSRATSRAPAMAATKVVAVVASHATPACAGEYSSTCCIIRDPTKMNDSSALNPKNAVMFAATSERFLSSAVGTSGAADRASIRTNTANSAAAAANNASAEPENQPCSTVWCNA